MPGRDSCSSAIKTLEEPSYPPSAAQLSTPAAAVCSSGDLKMAAELLFERYFGNCARKRP